MKTNKKYSIQKHTTKTKKKSKTKKSKTKTKKHTYKHKLSCSKSKSKSKSKSYYNVNKIVHHIEFDILFTIISTQILFLINIKTPKQKVKKQTVSLLKEIRNNNKLITNTITDKELNIIFERIYKYAVKLNKNINKSKINKTTQTPEHILTNKHKFVSNKIHGGFFFKDLEDKGDAPITGNDLVKFLDEIDSFVYNAQWTDEGEFLRHPYTLFNMLRGNVDAFKSYVTWHVLPKYYQMYPPFVKWSGIKDILIRKWEDIPDYLLAYKTYNTLQNEYLVSKGLKSPTEVKGDNNFFTKFANKVDRSIQQFQQLRRKYQGIKSGNYTLQVPL